MDRYYDDGFSGFKRHKPAEQSAMRSFMSDSSLASAWYPKEQPREVQFSVGDDSEMEDNPIVRLARSKPDSRPAARAEVEETLKLPKMSRMRSLVKGSGEAPQDESDDSEVKERRTESKRRRKEALTSLREHAKKESKGRRLCWQSSLAK